MEPFCMYCTIDQMSKYICFQSKGSHYQLRNRKRKNSVGVETGISMNLYFFFNYVIYWLWCQMGPGSRHSSSNHILNI